MAYYEVYLEASAEGLWMAHVPGLTGCIARGQSREEVLARLPEVIAAYQDWLVRHGESAGSVWLSAADEIEIRVAGQSECLGPFNPGDAAAFFPPDREPVTPEEMEHCFRLMGYARSDLMALVRHLPPDVLDWQPFPEWFSLRRVLRHVGNAEQWYVSRLVPPESLPAEWGADDDLPLIEFLEMERRTAVARLRQLTPEERSGVFHPTTWTRHPEEAWTLRKVLRRFLEHEREHTGQVREVLELYRRVLLACLAAGHAALLDPLPGLDERTLTQEPVMDDCTARDLLANLAARDRRDLQAVTGQGGQEPAGSLGPGGVDGGILEPRATPRRDHDLDEVLVELAAAQAAWLAWLEVVPVEALFAPSPGAARAAAARLQRLEEHAARLAAWRKGRDDAQAAAPDVAVLQAALLAGRQELLAAAALIPAGQEDVRPVCGTWTLTDIIGHVADWELFGVEGLRHMAGSSAAGPLPVEPVTDIDAWNEAHAAARRGQPRQAAWADLVGARQALTEILAGMDATALAQRFRFPWGPEGTPCEWLRVYLAHDREHAAGLRDAVSLPETYSSS